MKNNITATIYTSGALKGMVNIDNVNFSYCRNDPLHGLQTNFDDIKNAKIELACIEVSNAMYKLYDIIRSEE